MWKSLLHQIVFFALRGITTNQLNWLWSGNLVTVAPWYKARTQVFMGANNDRPKMTKLAVIWLSSRAIVFYDWLLPTLTHLDERATDSCCHILATCRVNVSYYLPMSTAFLLQEPAMLYLCKQVQRELASILIDMSSPNNYL